MRVKHTALTPDTCLRKEPLYCGQGAPDREQVRARLPSDHCEADVAGWYKVSQ